MKNFTSVLFNTQVKSLKHDGHLYTFRNVLLDLILHHNKYIKDLAGEANMITFALLQAADVLGISSDALKAWGYIFKE